MKFNTLLRAGSMRWAAPFIAFLTLFYYFVGESVPLEEYRGYAPSLISEPLTTLYALAYAVAAALAVWESGRLRASGVWALAPARSRFSVATNAVFPAVVLSWLVILVPAGLSLARAGTLPTLGSLRFPVVALVVCVAYSVIGFSVGLKLPRVIAAPITAVVVWVCVAFTRAIQPYWIRHMSGQYAGLGFGELPSFISLVPPILFVGGIATAISSMWLPFRNKQLAAALSCAVCFTSVISGYEIAKSWGHAPPLVSGQAPMSCLGRTPEVCMPEVVSEDLADVQEEAESVLGTLSEKGALDAPSKVTDQLASGRFWKKSSAEEWYIPLTSAVERGSVRYQVMLEAVRFPCERPDPATAHAALLWAASVTGQVDGYEKRTVATIRSEKAQRAEKQAQDMVRSALKEPDQVQGAWFRKTLVDACGRSSE